jgi:ABC-type molybdate transport system substrate-binding protein
VRLLSPSAFGTTTEIILDKLLAPGVRVGVSRAKVDPLGDYTVRQFEAADSLRLRTAAALQPRVLDTPPGSPPPKSRDTDADAITAGHVDASVVYCSGRDRYAHYLNRPLLRFRQNCTSARSTVSPS